MTHYTRAELLSLYKDSYPFPSSFEKIKGAFVLEALKPQLIQNERLNVDGTKKIRVQETDKGKRRAPKQTAEIKAQVQWYYLDPTDKIQGPFPSDQLRGWWEKNYFPAGLRISQTQDKDSFRPASEVFSSNELAFTFNPSLFPFIIESQPAEMDPLQKLVVDFDNQ